MANSRLAIGSSLNLKRINNSVSSLSKSVRQAQSSTARITKSLLESNRDKRKSLALSSTLFRRRREATLRREREDLLEAGSITGAVKRTTRVASSSTKGFLGRILDFLGTLLVGWGITNLPTIMKLASDLTKRMQKYFGILQGFVGGVSSFLLGLPNRFGEIFNDISNFRFESLKDIFDRNLERMKTAFQRLQNGITGLIVKLRSIQTVDDLLDYIDMKRSDFTIPGIEKLKELLGQKDDKTQTQTQTQGGGSTNNQGGSAGGGTRSSNPLLQLISGAEGAYDSMYPSEKYPQMLNMTMTELVAFQKLKLKDGRESAAVGAYQFLYPEQYVALAGLTMNSKFTPENQDKLALAFLKARGITVEAFKKDRIGTALKLAKGFAGVPVLAPVYSSFAGRIVQRGESFYQGYKGNKATVSVDRVEKSIDRLIGPTQPKPQPKPQPPGQNQKVSFKPTGQNNNRATTLAFNPPLEPTNRTILVVNRTRTVTEAVAKASPHSGSFGGGSVNSMESALAMQSQYTLATLT